MKVKTNQERLNELFDADPRNDTAIAADLDVSKQAISAWRKGIRSPKKQVLLKIANKYNVNLDWLMGFDVDKSANPNRRVIIPDSDLFNKVLQNMSPEDYEIVIDAYERTYQKLKERGEL